MLKKVLSNTHVKFERFFREEVRDINKIPTRPPFLRGKKCLLSF
jgi:hypothetical protein